MGQLNAAHHLQVGGREHQRHVVLFLHTHAVLSRDTATRIDAQPHDLRARIQYRLRDAWHALVGTDIQVQDHFVIYADWISGRANAVSLGGVIVINRHDSVQASMLRGNDEDQPSGVLVAVTHTFDLADPWEW